jgi:hypothetical protein
MNLKHTLWSTLLSMVFALPGWSDPTPAGIELSQARENVRISQEAADRIRARLDALRLDPMASAEEIATYQQYLARVEAQLEEHRRLLATLEQSRGRGATRSPQPPQAVPSPTRIEVPPDVTEQSEVRALDTRLNASLQAFDEKLLQEVETRSDQEAASGAGSQAGGGRAETARDGEPGEGASATSTSSSGTGADTRTASTEGQTTPGRQDEQSGPGGRRVQDGQTGAGSARGTTGRRTPPDIPDGRDDDIVARQIREAAEKERDPELRKRLWEEYRRYKSGAG